MPKNQKNKAPSSRSRESRPEAFPPKVFCVVGFSGSGKTTLVSSLVSEFAGRGFSVGTIKHDVHGFSMDQPGKDSWKHKKAGAKTALVTSPWGIGMVSDSDHDHQPMELLHLFRDCDIVIVEGFKNAELPKIEAYRPENKKPPACKGDPHLMAVVSNASLVWGVRSFKFDQVESLADFLNDKLKPKMSEASEKKRGSLISTERMCQAG